MPTQKTLKDIIDRLVADCLLIIYSKLLLEDRKKQASNKMYDSISEIKSLIKEKLPKKITIVEKKSDYERVQGYNQALTEIEKILEEL